MTRNHRSCLLGFVLWLALLSRLKLKHHAEHFTSKPARQPAVLEHGDFERITRELSIKVCMDGPTHTFYHNKVRLFRYHLTYKVFVNQSEMYRARFRGKKGSSEGHENYIRPTVIMLECRTRYYREICNIYFFL